MYTLWLNIRERCNNSNHPHFSDYGGRGIKIFPEWENSFETFIKYILENIGERPPIIEGYKRYWSIDRINNDGNYEPENIKWSNPSEQKKNQRKRRYWKKPVEEL